MTMVLVFNPAKTPVVRKDGGMIAGREWATLPRDQVQHLIERNSVVLKDTIPDIEPEPIVEASKAVGDEPDDDTPEPDVESKPRSRKPRKAPAKNDAPTDGAVDDESAPVVDTISKTARRSRAKKES